MRQADCAIRLRQPQQPDLIQRRLFTVHFHLYASPSYVAKYGKPASIADLKNHRIVTFGEPVPTYLSELNWLETVGRLRRWPARADAADQRHPVDQARGADGRRHRHAARLCGRARIPGLVQLLPETEVPSFDTYFGYPDAMREPGQAAGLPRLHHRQGAQLGLLSCCRDFSGREPIGRRVAHVVPVVDAGAAPPIPWRS